MSLPKLTYNDHYRGFQIWKDYKDNSACRTDILDCGIDMLEAMRARHNRFMFIRWDLHFPANSQCSLSNQLISKFNKKLKAYFSNAKTKTGNRKKIHMEFLWSREHKASCLNFHVHYVAVFDGNWFHANNPYGILKGVVEPIWLKILNLSCYSALVEYCDEGKYNGYSQNGIMVYRNDNNDVAFRECVRWLSYSCKCSEHPDHILKYGNTWGSSGFRKINNANVVVGV